MSDEAQMKFLLILMAVILLLIIDDALGKDDTDKGPK